MRRLYYAMIPLLGFSLGMSQEIDLGNFNGSLESNSQWYQKDEKLGFDPGDAPFRSNNYFRFDYNAGKISAGAQFESYLPEALLGYSDQFKGNKIAMYYARYKNNKLDITAGNYYDQFGSGLIYRSWEDRQIGINNSLRGVRVAYTPNDFTTLKGVLGKQRRGFEFTDGTVQGLDLETNILKVINKDNTSPETLKFGASYIGKNESYSGPLDDVPTTVNDYSARLDYNGRTGFYGGLEYVNRGKDVVVQNSQISNKTYGGDAFLFNLGYSRKGFGINTTFRRMENMGIYSQRSLSDPSNNAFNEGNINYTPALTKQHDYLLTNIYVYQAQPQLNFLTQQVGEIGGQADIFVNADKGTFLGGKYGTKLAINGSYWNGLNATFEGDDYTVGFFDFGKKFWHDVNFEISKKWNKKWYTIFTYANMYYDKGIIEGGNYSHIISNIVVGDVLYTINPKNSIRFEAQHLQSKRDRKNWLAGVVEYNLNYKWNFYVNDTYNYGNDDPDKRYHYYNVGGSYTEGSTRVSANYGRQRGGLICVGGVCRYVPENTGLTLGLQFNF